MLFSRSVNIILNIFISFLTIFKLLIIFLFDTFEAFVIILIIFCNIFLFFYSIFELYLQLSKAIDHIHRYHSQNLSKLYEPFLVEPMFFFTICNFYNISIIPHLDNMQMYKESNHHIHLSNNPSNSFSR